MLVFGYTLIRGTASDGQTSGDNLYPAPTLQVFPGETLIVHFENALTGLTIRDFFDPRYIAKGDEVPLYPEQLTSSPLNLHIHGVHISPKGNSDNVMLHIPAGMSNTYTYRIPKNMPQGAYWYHSHLHMAHDTTRVLRVGRPARHRSHRRQSSAGHPAPHPDPEHGAAVQCGVRSGRRSRAAQQSQLAAMGQHEEAAGSRRAGQGHVPAVACAGEFRSIEKGRAVLHRLVFGPAGRSNFRGRFEFIPSNLQRFAAHAGRPRTSRPTHRFPTTSAMCSSR